MKQLVFDTTDVDSIKDSDSVGAFLRSSDGTLIDHTNVGGKNAIDVNIAGGAVLEVALDHTNDSVALGDGTNLYTSTTVGADIGLDVNLINTSIEVTATDLDIRDLSSATDSVAAVQSGTWVIDSITNPVTVTATDLDIRDLSFASDSVDVSGSSVTVNDAALANTAVAHASNDLAVADTAEDVVASPLVDRKYLLIYNNNNKNVYIGASGVTAATGFPLSPSSTVILRAGSAVDLEFVGSTGVTPNIRTLELA